MTGEVWRTAIGSVVSGVTATALVIGRPLAVESATDRNGDGLAPVYRPLLFVSIVSLVLAIIRFRQRRAGWLFLFALAAVSGLVGVYLGTLVIN